MKEGGLMNIAGKEGILGWEGQGVAEGNCCFYLSLASIEKAADGGWHSLRSRYTIITVHQRSLAVCHLESGVQVLCVRCDFKHYSS